VSSNECGRVSSPQTSLSKTQYHTYVLASSDYGMKVDTFNDKNYDINTWLASTLVIY